MNDNCAICSGRLCPMGNDFRDYEYNCPGDFSLYLCRKCGVVELRPQPSMEELLRAYPNDYHGYNYAETKSGIFNFLQKFRIKNRISFYKKLAGDKADVLDIGCGDGHYLDYFKQLPGWNTLGIEFKKEIAERGLQLGRKIIIGTFEELEFSDNSFDLIIMNHLLEHVPDPIGLLKKALKKLKSGGRIVGELPNILSWDYLFFGKFWGGLHIPRHLFNFTPRALTIAADKAGFDNCRIFYNLNTSHWALSCQNRLQGTKFFKTNLTFGRAKYYNFLLLLFIPLNVLAKIFRKTSIMNFVIKK